MGIITRPINIVDIHSHILPAMDDGATDVSESNKIINSLINQGVDTIVLTPHYYSLETSIDEFLDNRAKSFDTLQASLESKDINLILGCEAYFSIYLHGFDRLPELCMEGTKYLLLEMPFMKKWDSRTISYIEKIIYNNNIIPVIAHAERYSPIYSKNYQIIDVLSELGCFIQMNASSLFQKQLRKHCFKIIETGARIVLGSDSHDSIERKPEIGAALNFLEEQYGKGVTDKILDNSKKILSRKESPIHA